MKVARKLWTWALALVATFAVVLGLSTVAYAAAGDVPDHNKTLTDNHDGTYTISLDVTGDSEKKPNHVNVIVIFDTSSSMNTNTGNTEVTYTPTSDTGGWYYQNNLYGLIDGEYHQLTRTQTGNWPNITYHFWYNGQEYTGQRYTRQQGNQTRLQAAEEAVNSLASSLLAYNTQEGNDPDTVEMAFVDFANTAVIAQQPTTDYSTFEAVVNSRDAGNNNRGTNWEAGLRTALNVDFDDEDPTYVIFVSDGNPTFYLDNNGNRQGTGQEGADNVATCYNQAVPAAEAIVDAGYEFYTIGIYGSLSRMQSLTTDAGAPAENYYSAEDTAALQAALAEILKKIEMSGIANAEIVDGTTSKVATSSGVVSLINIVPDSFKYYRDGVEWTSADTPAPPAATINSDGEVEWDLSSLDVLENGVKYTVTFDVYPSQTALDYAARLENGEAYTDVVPAEARQYFDANGALATNTTATLSYDDTRTDADEQPVNYTNPPKQPMSTSTMSVEKLWVGGTEPDGSIELDVMADDDTTPFARVTLSKDDGWKEDIYISYGLIKGDQVLTGAEGHDFSFAELPSVQYRWELDAPVVHPMIIDGTPTMLVKEDAEHPAGGAQTYTINGATYFVDASVANLTATNYRRSNLNLTKVVTGEGAPETALFPFTLTVVNSKAANGSADDTSSDYYVWFSVFNGANVKRTTNATEYVDPETGETYYYAPSGSDITVELQAGDNLRFTNLPSGSTYTFTEGNTDGFRFNKAENTGEADSTFKANGKTTTGTVENPGNKTYTVTYTNEYALVDITVKKTWDDNSNQDGIRPDELTLTVNGLPTGTTAPTPEITKSEDGNTWTYTWKGLPKYDAQGEEITYTVTEGTVPDGYTVSGSPASNNGTITNKHTPEVYETVTVKKNWDDNNNQDGVRPTSVNVQLKADGEPVGDAVTLNADNSWSYTWKNLPKKSNGAAITYTVEETPVPAGYDVTVTGDVEKGFTVTNKHTPDTTEATIVKVWEDNDNQDGKRPETLKVTLSNGTEVTLPQDGKWTATVTGLPKYNNGVLIEYSWTEETIEGYSVKSNETEGTVTTITNEHTPETTSASVTKAWSDNDNQDGIRPSTVVVVLSNGTEVTLPAEDGSWTATVSNLPKYADGQEIAYAWTEKTVPDGYTVSYGEEGAEAAPNGGTITNTHTPSTIDIPVTKTWDDADNQDGKRPESITVNLLADGEKVQDATVTPAEDGTWSYTFAGVPEYANGKKITYTVTEEPIEGYDPTIDGYSITNKHTPSTIDIDVEKKWDDADNQDGKRPESIIVNLLANGEKVQEATITPAEDGTWTYTFVGVPEYANGEKITYTVTEEPVEGYDPAIDGYLIVNTHVPEKTTVTVTKTWDDADDQDGLRPGSITVNLFADGEKVTSASITPAEDGTWSYTFTELPKYAAGKEIAYTVTEEKVDGYETTVDGFSITNKHTPEQTSITVTKKWDDADNKDGIRPSSITVNLFADGTQVETATLNEGNGWTYTWEELDKKSAGKDISYTVSEDKVEGYTAETTGSAENGYTITNTHIAKPDAVTSDPPVQKVVQGNPATAATFTFQMKAVTEGAPMPEGSADGVKTVQITGSGSYEFGVMTYTEAGEWVYEITELNGGVEGYTYDTSKYTLTVKVEEVPDGSQVKLVKTETITGGNGSGTPVFTNVYKAPVPKTGDATPQAGMLALAAAVVTGIAAFGARRRED